MEGTGKSVFVGIIAMKKKETAALSAIIVFAIIGILVFSVYRSSESHRKEKAEELTKQEPDIVQEDSFMCGVISEIADGALYITATEGNCFVNNWMKYIPDGSSFDIGDEVVILYNGIATEETPAELCGVTKIDLSDAAYNRKYGNESAEDELPRLVMVNDVLWYDCAVESSVIGRCGMMDGTIDALTENENGIPTQNNTSNFGIGYGYQYGSDENTIEVYIDDQWCVFRKYEKSLFGIVDMALENLKQ